MPFHEGPNCCLELYYNGQRRASGRCLHRGPGSHLKHRISKREYKVVLSKTYIRTILLMLKYQGKGRWGSTCRSASFDLASPELRLPDFEVRSVHESTTCLQPIHHYGYFLDFPTRRHTIALTLILRVLEVSLQVV